MYILAKYELGSYALTGLAFQTTEAAQGFIMEQKLPSTIVCITPLAKKVAA